MEKNIATLIENNQNLQSQWTVLQSIPGIGATTATAVLAELPNFKMFSSAREVAAFAGLTPNQRQSGTSVKGKTRLSKVGSSRLRKALYMPALVAKQHNSILISFCQKLKEKGKHNMLIIAAAMRKLLHIIYGVLKSGKESQTT